MFKKQFLIICFTLILHKCYSQHSDLYLIKLKNGLTLKAELIKIVPDSFIVFKQYGLETKLKMSEVIEINFSETNQYLITKKGKPIIFKRNLPDTGWSFGYQLGFSGGLINDFGWTRPTTSFVSRISILKSVYKLNQVGVLLGFDPYAAYEFVIFPIELHGRHYFYNKPKSPLLYANFGYGLNVSRGNPINNGGLTYSFGLGKSFRTKNQKVFSLMFGIKNQQAQDRLREWNWQTGNSTFYDANFSIRRIEFRTELLF